MRLILTLAESLSVVTDKPLVLIVGAVVVGAGVVLTGVVEVLDCVEDAGGVVVGATVVCVVVLLFVVGGVVVLLPWLSCPDVFLVLSELLRPSNLVALKLSRLLLVMSIAF